MKIAQRFQRWVTQVRHWKSVKRTTENLPIGTVKESAVRSTDYTHGVISIPPMKSVGYFHSSASPTFEAKANGGGQSPPGVDKAVTDFFLEY